MGRIILLYLVSSGFLVFYSREISSVLAAIGNRRFISAWLLAVGISLCVRILLLRRHQKYLSADCLRNEGLSSLSLRELYSDVGLWILLGPLMGALTGKLAWNDWKTGLLLLFCSLMIGIVIGAFNYLDMEKALINFLRTQPRSIPVRRPRMKVSVASKVALLLYSVIGVSVTFVAFMMFDEASSLLKRGDSLSAPVLQRMTYEIGAVALVMVTVSILITRRLTGNLKLLLKIHSAALMKVEDGVYDTKIPIVTSDEFGMIAAQTNGMIDGLRDREYIRDTFGRYLSKEVRDVILSTRVPREAEARNVTILFCDLRCFTSFVENSSPQKVVEKLNQYFTEMVQAIEKRQGLVLQFIGDEIEAVFGAPLDLEDHPSIAVEAAIEMRQRLSDLNRRWEDQGINPFKHGIGIHSGEVVAASIGSPERLSYLMVGDTVNLASRIQHMTKDCHCDILISGETRRRLSERFSVEYVRTVQVRGKSEQTDLFKVL